MPPMMRLREGISSIHIPDRGAELGDIAITLRTKVRDHGRTSHRITDRASAAVRSVSRFRAFAAPIRAVSVWAAISVPAADARGK